MTLARLQAVSTGVIDTALSCISTKITSKHSIKANAIIAPPDQCNLRAVDLGLNGVAFGPKSILTLLANVVPMPARFALIKAVIDNVLIQIPPPWDVVDERYLIQLIFEELRRQQPEVPEPTLREQAQTLARILRASRTFPEAACQVVAVQQKSFRNVTGEPPGFELSECLFYVCAISKNDFGSDWEMPWATCTYSCEEGRYQNCCCGESFTVEMTGAAGRALPRRECVIVKEPVFRRI